MKASPSRLSLILILAGILLLPIVVVRANFAKDEWIQIKSKNFTLIGNASEKDIRKVGIKLEQFRETFRQLFRAANLSTPIPTNVIVFKNDSSYKPFKPKRADGRINNEIAGYFQAGEDVNYITLAVEGDEKDVFGTIFHEYVHFIINTNFGKSAVPQWFNEGLAEYYQTFEIVDDQKVKLGLPQTGHVNLLQQSQLMPLDTLFNVTNYQLHQTEGHSRSMFYAQSWALVHYLTLTGKSDSLNKFMTAVSRGVVPKTAFQDAFQTNYEKMEKELRAYVFKRTYSFNEVNFKEKLTVDTQMTTSPLSESQINAFLGDLLYHTHRFDDAVPYLLNALRLDPESSLANTALGMIKLEQRRFGEARQYLETAISGDPNNHIAFYRYAVLLSRDGRDEFGFVSKFETAVTKKMRDSLNRAIAIAPSFTESYELLAFLALVNNEQLDEAVNYLRTALEYQPGSQRYLIRIAEIFARQNKYDDAKRIAEKIAAAGDDNELRQRAAEILGRISQQIEIDRRNEDERRRYEAAVAASGGKTRLTKRIESLEKPSEAEIVRMQEMENLRAINDSLRNQTEGEVRVRGRIDKIDCKKRPIVFTIKTASETFTLTSRDFESLQLNALDPTATDFNVGCDAKIAIFDVLVTYKEANSSRNISKGELVAIEFVPANFRILSRAEMQNATLTIYDQTDDTAAPRPVVAEPATIVTPEEFEQKRRELLMNSIKDSLRTPGAGEKRELGYLEKIECGSKASYFYLRTDNRVVKLLNLPSHPPAIIVFTSDLQGVMFGCETKSIEFPALFIYTLKPDNKSKTDGVIVSLEFVPKSFVLEP